MLQALHSFHAFRSDAARRKTVLLEVAILNWVIVTLAVIGRAMTQPTLLTRGLITILLTTLITLAVLEISRRGKTALAGALLVASNIALVVQRAVTSGGIRAPGVMAFCTLSLMAGLVLGEAAGLVTVLVCAVCGLGLVLAEQQHVIAQTTTYHPISFWWMNVLYMATTAVLLRIATRSINRAHDRLADELQERRKAEEKLGIALEAGEIGVWEWTPSTGTLIWDGRMYELYGRAPGCVMNRDVWASSVIGGDRLEEEDSAPAGTRTEREFRIRRPDGGIRHIFSAQKILQASDVAPRKIIGINVDVTEQRLADAKILFVKSQLETLVAQAKIGILIQRDFKPLVANAELARIFGYGSEAEILAAPDIRAVMPADAREQVTANYQLRLSGKDPRTVIPIQCRRKDGSMIDVDVRGFPIVWDGEPAMCAMVTDETQQRRLEAQLRQAHRLEAVGQLTGGIAHDFNNLLTVILGNADALETMLADNPAAREFAHLTKSAARRGADLTSQLLSFSRQQTLNVETTNIEELVADVYKLVRRTLGDRIQIRIVQAEGLWWAHADISQLQNALLNMAINARDAMPEGGTLTVETRNMTADEAAQIRQDQPGQSATTAASGDFVLISMSDTGIGMDEKTRLRAFEPFFTTKPVGRGSGLGLSMVYGFVTQLGGFVQIESAPGKGTAVKIHLPRGAVGHSLAAPTAPAPLPGGTERILLVEDNDLVRELCTIQLKRLGYQVIVACDGPEAVAILENGPGVQLLFTDVQLPGGIDGRALAELAHSKYPDLPVLLSSGYASSGKIDASAAGCRIAALNKPYEPEQLARILRDLLRPAVPGAKV